MPLMIFDVLGKERETLVREEMPPGPHTVQWIGTNQPIGIYFYRFTIGSNVAIKRMMLIVNDTSYPMVSSKNMRVQNFTN